MKRHPEAVDTLALTLAMMEEDVFHHRLRTLKLLGDFNGCWACTIALLAVGTHDEVY